MIYNLLLLVHNNNLFWSNCQGGAATHVSISCYYLVTISYFGTAKEEQLLMLLSAARSEFHHLHWADCLVNFNLAQQLHLS